MSEIEKSLRYRVAVSQTSTGKKSWDCTVDGNGYEMDEVLKKSDLIVSELEKRYPPEMPKEK